MAAVIILAAALTVIASPSAGAVNNGSTVWTARFNGPANGADLALKTV